MNRWYPPFLACSSVIFWRSITLSSGDWTLVFLSWQRIGYNVFFSFPVFEFERNILDFQSPSSLSSICDPDLLEVSKVFVIGDHPVVFLIPLQIFPPLFYRLDDSQHFFLRYNVVLFCWIHFFRHEFQELLFLWDYSDRRMIQYVSFDCQWFVQVKYTQQIFF